MSHGQNQNDRGLLRREARPTQPEQLTRSQQNALRFLLMALSEALEKARNDVNLSDMASQSFLDVKGADGGLCLMVSGDRGTGKTSLVLTLQKLLGAHLSTQQSLHPFCKPWLLLRKRMEMRGSQLMRSTRLHLVLSGWNRLRWI